MDVDGAEAGQRDSRHDVCAEHVLHAAMMGGQYEPHEEQKPGRYDAREVMARGLEC
jgi:hypothetical protein